MDDRKPRTPIALISRPVPGATYWTAHRGIGHPLRSDVVPVYGGKTSSGLTFCGDCEDRTRGLTHAVPPVLMARPLAQPLISASPGTIGAHRDPGRGTDETCRVGRRRQSARHPERRSAVSIPERCVIRRILNRLRTTYKSGLLLLSSRRQYRLLPSSGLLMKSPRPTSLFIL